MKRQIKFRAWDKTCKVIHFMLEQSHKLPLPQPLHTYLENTERFDIMQFTGLQDKNGKDIFEGDILKVEWQKDSIRSYLQMSDSYTEYKEIVFVSYLKLSFVFILNNGKYFNLPKSCTITIIGNIYENPELLNTTENE